MSPWHLDPFSLDEAQRSFFAERLARASTVRPKRRAKVAQAGARLGGAF
jgi:hypothetical protein